MGAGMEADGMEADGYQGRLLGVLAAAGVFKWTPPSVDKQSR